jgi:hypothetical protein
MYANQTSNPSLFFACFWRALRFALAAFST